MATSAAVTAESRETTTSVEVETTREDPPATLQSIIDISDVWDRLLLFVPPSTLGGAISKVFSAAFGQTVRVVFRTACGQSVVLIETRPRNEYWVPWLEPALTPVAPMGVLAQWRSSNVFTPPLEKTACGVVRPAAWDYSALPAREVYRELMKLRALAEDTRIGNGLRGIGWSGGQGDGQWIPFLVPWSVDSDGDFTPEALLRKLGAHPELLSGGQIVEREYGVRDEDEYGVDPWIEEDEYEEDENDAFRHALNSFLRASQLVDDPFSAFGHYGNPTLVFHVGTGMLNVPVPCFAVAQVAHSPCSAPH